MLIQEKKFKEYLSQEYEPVDETAMPFLVDLRAIKAYADREIRGRFFDPFCHKGLRGQEFSYSKSQSEVESE